jgi:hypothetical protein
MSNNFEHSQAHKLLVRLWDQSQKALLEHGHQASVLNEKLCLTRCNYILWSGPCFMCGPLPSLEGETLTEDELLGVICSRAAWYYTTLGYSFDPLNCTILFFNGPNMGHH